MRIAVVGTGGVGGYFGGRLAAAGADVSFIARGAHLAAMRSRGLRIVSPKGDVHVPRVNATDNPADIGAVEVVLFTVKLYDAEAALALLPSLVGPDTVVIPLQNGVDGIELVTRAVGRDHAAGGTCYVSAMIAEPGVIKHTAMDHLIFGEVDGTRSARLERLLDACAKTNFQTTLSPNITVDVWTKFTRLSVLSGMTAVTRSPLGVIVNDPELFAMLKAAVAEAVAVAKARGVAVRGDMIEDVARAYQALPYETKASMLVDLENGRRLELPWLSGAVARIGREVGVPTPIHSFIAAVLRPHVDGMRNRE
ncbi:MAG TPA: 2-dehydropantoate 2-reductase [Vicinamibacterales bacterium]|jgi:2-dehydropantoate 2-reductase